MATEQETMAADDTANGEQTVIADAETFENGRVTDGAAPRIENHASAGDDDTPSPTDAAGDAAGGGVASDDAIPDDDGDLVLATLAQQRFGMTPEQVEQFKGMSGLEAILMLQGGQAPGQQQQAGHQANIPADEGEATFKFPWEADGVKLEESEWDADTAKVFAGMRDHYEQKVGRIESAVAQVLTHLIGQQDASQRGEFNRHLDEVATEIGRSKDFTAEAARKAAFDRFKSLAPVLAQNGVTGKAAVEMTVAMITGAGLKGIATNASRQAVSAIKDKLATRRNGTMQNPAQRQRRPSAYEQALDTLNRLNPRGAL